MITDPRDLELRGILYNAVVALLTHNQGDTYAVEKEVASAVEEVTGSSVYCDIHR